MAADNPNAIAFELESSVFCLKKTQAGVEFLVDGESMAEDLPMAKINREDREVTFMGRSAGKLASSQDLETLATTLETWFPNTTRVEHVHSVETFDSKKSNGLTVAKFSAEWCGPCKMVAPAIDKMSNKYPDVTFLHVDGDELKQLMRRENASCYPTFFFYQDGEKQSQKIEGADATKVEATLKTLGAQPAEVEENYAGDGELTIVVERDTYIVEKEEGGVSLTVNGKKVLPAGKCPDVEVDTDSKKVTIGRGGGVIYNSPDYNVEEIMQRIKAMFPSHVVHVHSAEQFDKIVKENKNVVAKYSASWCGPCHAIAPFVKELSNEFENVVFLHIDVDEVKQLSQREGVSAMPTFDFWQDGKKQEGKRIRGGNRNKLKAQVQEFGAN